MLLSVFVSFLIYRPKNNFYLRLYDPQLGTIQLDGVNIKDFNPQWLRREIGIVNQEPTLFSGTIKENILYALNAENDISKEAFEQTLRDAHVDEIVSRLPDGLETIIGQRGATLSGGQRQRIALARALIKVSRDFFFFFDDRFLHDIKFHLSEPSNINIR